MIVTDTMHGEAVGLGVVMGGGGPIPLWSKTGSKRDSRTLNEAAKCVSFELIPCDEYCRCRYETHLCVKPVCFNSISSGGRNT